MSGKWRNEPLAIQALKPETFKRIARTTWSPTDTEFQKESQPQRDMLKRVTKPTCSPTDMEFNKKAQPRRDMLKQVEKPTWSPSDAEFQKEPQPYSEAILKDPDITTHAVLRKHYKYLLPWLSSQPKPRADAENIEAEALSYRQMTNEFRQLSLSHFMDLSWAIYQDVRRREQTALYESVSGRLQLELWTKTKQNESRMVLCRILNDHFYRVITAVVLEQARRLSDLRIRIYRSGILAKA